MLDEGFFRGFIQVLLKLLETNKAAWRHSGPLEKILKVVFKLPCSVELINGGAECNMHPNPGQFLSVIIAVDLHQEVIGPEDNLH